MVYVEYIFRVYAVHQIFAVLNSVVYPTSRKHSKVLKVFHTVESIESEFDTFTNFIENLNKNGKG